MNIRHAIGVLIPALGLLPACYARKPLDNWYTVRSGVREQCARICRSWGMTLGAMVVIANSTGCVCSAAPSAAGAVQAGGLAVAYHAVAVEEKEKKRSTEQQRK